MPKESHEQKFGREATGVNENDHLRCGYVNVTLPTETPSVAAGDLMKPEACLPASHFRHPYDMPDHDERRFFGGMAPRLKQNAGEEKDYSDKDEFEGEDHEWDGEPGDRG